MDCKTARLILHFSRPLAAELDPDEALALESHLADCAECRQYRQAELAIDDRLGRAMRDVPIPDGLGERIVATLAKQQAGRRRVRLIVAGLSAAAVLLLAGWFFWPRPPLTIDLASLGHERNFPPGSAKAVEDAFAQKGIAVRAPVGFNYARLTHYDLADLHGQRVPYLQFQAGTGWLRIYILDGSRFDLAGIAAAPAPSSGLVTVQWGGRSPDGQFGYIIEYTGSLEPFKAPNLLPAT